MSNLTPTEYIIKEAHAYTLILPIEYWGPGSYLKWMRVGWALKNTDPRLIITWIKFITFTDKNNLDLMIKQMIEIMKQKNYSYTFLNSDNNSFDKYTINILKSNNFTGDDFLFLNL